MNKWERLYLTACAGVFAGSALGLYLLKKSPVEVVVIERPLLLSLNHTNTELGGRPDWVKSELQRNKRSIRKGYA